jgi:predicted nuclease with TOPRIM domain
MTQTELSHISRERLQEKLAETVLARRQARMVFAAKTRELEEARERLDELSQEAHRLEKHYRLMEGTQ